MGRYRCDEGTLICHSYTEGNFLAKSGFDVERNERGRELILVISSCSCEAGMIV